MKQDKHQPHYGGTPNKASRVSVMIGQGLAALRGYSKRFASRFTSKFASDCRGVSAVEFALILPILVLIYAGTVDLSRGMDANKKVNRVASMVGDLVSHQITIDPQLLNDIFKIGATTMSPDTRSPSIKVTFIQVAKEPKINPPANVIWSQATSGTKADVTDSLIYLPNEANKNLQIPEMTYIKVVAQYTYLPINSWLIKSIPMSEVYYISPRNTTVIRCDTCAKVEA